MRRLFEDPEQPQALRDELIRSRDAGHDYPAELKLAQLQAALADSTQRQDGRVDAARVPHPAWKLALVAAVSGGAAAWLAWPTAQPVRSPQQQIVEPAQANQAPPPAVPPTAAGPAPAAQPPTAAAQPEPAPEAPAQDAPAKSSRREIAQLIRIRSLLARDPAAALRLAERSEREFPGGLLSEERRALAIVALARTGARESAAIKARDYLARYPQSPMRSMLEVELER